MRPAGDRGFLIEFDPNISARELHAHAAEVQALACIVGHHSLYAIGAGETLVSAPRRTVRDARTHTIEVNFNGPEMREEFRSFVDGLHLTARYLGFRAGFAYLDGWPKEFALPRRPTSRPVKRGSFGIAGSVAGFYNVDSPGGWNILGTTDTLLWDARRTPPNLIEAGDEIVLVAVNREMSPPANIEELPLTIDGVSIDGGYVTVVTLPDYSRIASGRAPGGAFDEEMAIAANRAVGNGDDAPVIECAMVGPRVRFSSPRAVAWFGADCDLPKGEAFVCSEVSVGRIRNGLRGWLAVGPVEDRRPRLSGQARRLSSTGIIRIVPGPHEPSIDHVECEVTSQLNRVGIRLRPLQALDIQAPADLPSCGMQFGTIQLHPDGSLVAMGPDHGITGGYLQPMTVRWDERWKLAQLGPGERVLFAV